MTTVWATCQFEGTHYWPQATFPVEYLKDVHRHIFHVRLEVLVTSINRQVEFIQLKRDLGRHCTFKFGQIATAYSCEQMAALLFAHYTQVGYIVVRVDVSEDGENGGSWINDDVAHKS